MTRARAVAHLSDSLIRRQDCREPERDAAQPATAACSAGSAGWWGRMPADLRFFLAAYAAGFLFFLLLFA